MKLKTTKKTVGLCLAFSSIFAHADGILNENSRLHHFYIGVDGGYSMSLNSTDLNPFNGSITSFIVPENTTYQRDIGNAGMIGAVLGYEINNNLSVNVNYDYRNGFSWQVPGSYQAQGLSDTIFFTNNISIQTVLFNFELTPDVNWGKLKPYATGGIGLAVNKLPTIQNVNLANNSLYINISGQTQTNFSWDAGVGVNYAITDNLHYTLGYRFVSTGSLQSSNTETTNGGLNVAPGTYNITPFKANQILLNEVITGLRWEWDI